jgi:hypothetical protein
MTSVYAINKGVGKPIVFRGLKGQWISWFWGGLLLLLLCFALCYIAGVALIVCLVLVAIGGIGLFYTVYKLNKSYGEHGFMKQMAARMTPKRIACDQLFCK